MTVLYRPILIESAEQAEALPEGTIIIDALDLVARREKTGRYAGRWPTEEDGCLDDPVMPAQAFVPIEAEEQATHEKRTSRGVENFAPSNGIFPVPSRRFVTRWEPA